MLITDIIYIREVFSEYIIRGADKMKYILASESKRRKELLEMIGLEFEVRPSECDETFVDNLCIEEQSKRLAYIKAKTVFDNTNGERVIIGSDTMVIKGDKIYGKPHNKQQAIEMLRELNNSKHQVITSICVISQKEGNYMEQIDYDIADVYFKKMTNEEIESWIDKDNPYDKAGGYAIQRAFGVHIEKINGNYFTVVGLPIHKLYDMLKNI